MRLPRRVPWTSLSELDQVCTWIFAEEMDFEARVLGVNRLSAWKAITTLPHALESTLALLTAILEDDSNRPSQSALSLCLKYSTAIIRLVNGLVDPLQSGVYARPIASIATQLGLPPWLVEIRHAATHEDLPSLELLRNAARESMSWLLHNYFLPTLNPSTVFRTPLTTLRPLAPVLTQYKNLMKVITRDASVHALYKNEIISIEKDVERWVSEARVFASLALGDPGWDSGNKTDHEIPKDDPNERWALDKLCDGFLEKGILVPVSKKKRIFPSDSFSPPRSSLVLWYSLLNNIRTHHTTFPLALVHRIISFLLSESPTSAQSGELSLSDISFDMCLARWAFWIIDSWRAEEDDFRVGLKREVVVTLLMALGPGSAEIKRDRRAISALLEAACAGSEIFTEARRILASSASGIPFRDWQQTDVTEMDERLAALLLSEDSSDFTSGEKTHQKTQSLDTKAQVILGPGWRLLDDSTPWRPCPIGVYNGG